MKRRLLALLTSVTLVLPLQGDSLQVFTLQQFMRYVQAYHPMVWQAQLQADGGQANLLNARGGFDPKLVGNFDQKYFAGTKYYSLLGSGLKIPTWYGLEFKAGFENNEGVYLNPENRLPPEGLVYGGVSLSLGQGLVIDKRRAMLKQARIFADAARNEQELMLNQLFREAVSAYWDWSEKWQQLAIARFAYTAALERKEATVKTFLGGARPAIDTLEAFIQVQTREFNRNKAELDFRKAGLNLSNFLWVAGRVPLELELFLVPETYEVSFISKERLDSLAKRELNQIPTLLSYRYKVADLEIQRKLKAEQLKPKLDLQYNLLSAPMDLGGVTGIATSNYKWGLSFSMPLFLRAERGDLRLTRVKLQETQLQFAQKQLEINNKLKSNQLEIENLNTQLQLLEATTNNYFRLLEGERRRFAGGESSLFLINSRELSYLESRTKLVELRYTLEKLKAEQAALLGQLPETVNSFVQ